MRAEAGSRPHRRTAIRPALAGLMAGLSAALLLAAVVPSAHAVGGVSEAANRGLKLGVWDYAFLSGDPATRAQWLDRTAGVGATQVTIEADWRNIASGARPADPTDPSDPAYDWVQLDAAVRDATARGLSVMVMLFQAPDWAEGPSPAPPRTLFPDRGVPPRACLDSSPARSAAVTPENSRIRSHPAAACRA